MGIITVPGMVVGVDGGHLSAGLRAVPSPISIQEKLTPIIGGVIIMISRCL